MQWSLSILLSWWPSGLVEEWLEPGPNQVVEFRAGFRKPLPFLRILTWGLDVVPSQVEDRPFQGHVTYLKENGIYIFETMNTGPLVRDGAYEFMFVLGAARVRGAVQMIINPVAIR